MRLNLSGPSPREDLFWKGKTHKTLPFSPITAQRFQTLPEGRKEVDSPTRGKNRLMNLSPEAAGVAAGEAGRQAGRGWLAGGWRSGGQRVRRSARTKLLAGSPPGTRCLLPGGRCSYHPAIDIMLALLSSDDTHGHHLRMGFASVVRTCTDVQHVYNSNVLH